MAWGVGGVDSGRLFAGDFTAEAVLTVGRKYYYWLVTKDETGRPYIIFGGDNEDEARQKGLEMLGGLDFDIKRLPTRDRATASSYLKGNRLEQTHSLRQAGRRVGHDRSLRRLKRRISGGY